MKIRLLGKPDPKLGIEFEGVVKLVEGSCRVSGQTPVAREVVVEQSVIGVMPAGPIE